MCWNLLGTIHNTHIQALQYYFIDLPSYQDYLVKIVDNLIACSKYAPEDHITDDFVSLSVCRDLKAGPGSRENSIVFLHYKLFLVGGI